jgi:chromosomal replication initiation ATPase DnaA
VSQTQRTLSTRWREALEAIAHKHKLTLADLQEKHRFKAFVEARRECYAYLTDEGWSTPEIGGLFKRDHTTVCCALLDSDERRAVKRDRQRRFYYRRPLGARAVA